MTNAEWHIASDYKTELWINRAGIGWYKADDKERDSFPCNEGRVIQWPSHIPAPPKPGYPPRQVW